MAVPNTSTFSLQDVTNEFGLGASDGLQDCFNDSTDSDFDSAYKGSKDRLSNFRNYNGANILTSFSSTLGSSNQTTACGLAKNQTYYHDGVNALPAIGDNVYSDSAGTIGLVRNHYSASSGTYHIQTGNTTVDSVAIC
tara:strand:- start:582 stop:995 length:414 start_codon:yes stop_codon:yes gene_type:complete